MNKSTRESKGLVKSMTLEDKIKELEKVIWNLRPYIKHANGCQYSNYIWGSPDTDICTCDLKGMVEAARKALAMNIKI